VKTYVVDASVAAKWILPASGETLTREALELLKSYIAGDVRVIVPVCRSGDQFQVTTDDRG